MDSKPGDEFERINLGFQNYVLSGGIITTELPEPMQETLMDENSWINSTKKRKLVIHWS